LLDDFLLIFDSKELISFIPIFRTPSSCYPDELHLSSLDKLDTPHLCQILASCRVWETLSFESSCHQHEFRNSSTLDFAVGSSDRFKRFVECAKSERAV
jgi:hypothetical protein